MTGISVPDPKNALPTWLHDDLTLFSDMSYYCVLKIPLLCLSVLSNERTLKSVFVGVRKSLTAWVIKLLTLLKLNKMLVFNGF